MQTISVTPANGGWRVASDAIANDLMFRRGKAAERAAIRLAEAAAQTGEMVQIEVRLADGTVGRRFVCPGRVPIANDVEWFGVMASA